MYPWVLEDARLYAFLHRVDGEMADEAQVAGCPDCGGRLHCGDFPRKPRGARVALGAEYDRRFSFCCAADGCRHRLTPPSVRFLGRKVYLAAVVVLTTAMRHGVTRWRAEKLREVLGVSEKTLLRWRTFWQQEFPATRFWQEARARFGTPVAEAELPASLLERFVGEGAEPLVLMLRFIGPVTTCGGS